MNLVDGNGRIERVGAVAALHPLAVAPVVVEAPHARSGPRRRLAIECEGIALVDFVAVVARCDAILVAVAVACPGDESFPDPRVVLARAQRIRVRTPLVEIARHRHRAGIRRPHAEIDAAHCALAREMRAQLVVEARVRALLEEIGVVFAEARTRLFDFFMTGELRSVACVVMRSVWRRVGYRQAIDRRSHNSSHPAAHSTLSDRPRRVPALRVGQHATTDFDATNVLEFARERTRAPAGSRNADIHCRIMILFESARIGCPFFEPTTNCRGCHAPAPCRPEMSVRTRTRGCSGLTARHSGSRKSAARPHFFFGAGAGANSNPSMVETGKAMVKVKLPDGSIRPFDKPVTVAEVAQAIGPGLAKAALAGKVNGKLVDTSYRVDCRRRRRDRHRQGPGRARGHPPLDGAPARPRGEGAVSRRAGDDRPGDRGRLLLRLRVQAAVHARRPRRDREAHAEIAKRDIKVERQVMPRDEAVKFFRDMGEHYKAEIIAVDPDGEDDLALPPGRLHRPLPRPARALDRQAQGVQADEGRRARTGAATRRTRCCSASTARRGRRRRTRTPTCTASRKRRSATTASSAARSISSTCRTKRRAWCSGTRRAGRSGSRSSSTCAASTATTAISGSALPADPRRLAVEALGPLGQLPGEHVLHGVGERASTR